AVAGNLMLAASMDEQAALLGDDRFSHPANSSQLAGLVTQLQRTYGNAYVQRLLDSKALQAKLAVSSPDDAYEREADRVAEAVTQTAEVQRQELPEEEELQMKASSQIQHQEWSEEEELVQTRVTETQPSEVSGNLEARIDVAHSGGQPLADSARATLEPYFRHDFSQVRIHTDAEADKISRQLEAEAFTTGRDVFFKQGAYQPESETGKELLAHELTHVVQQSREPALQRQEAAAPAAEAPEIELEVGPSRSALEIWMTEVVIPITRAHTILGAGGPVRDRAGEAGGLLNSADSSVLVLQSQYRESNPAVSLRLMHLHGLLQGAKMALAPHAGVEISLETIRGWIDPSGENMVAADLSGMLSHL
ncbi:MAG TPA: DUF4157 domain-containing protein, partial [Dehalococcoidales bacterium]